MLFVLITLQRYYKKSKLANPQNLPNRGESPDAVCVHITYYNMEKFRDTIHRCFTMLSGVQKERATCQPPFPPKNNETLKSYIAESLAIQLDSYLTAIIKLFNLLLIS